MKVYHHHLISPYFIYTKKYIKTNYHSQEYTIIMLR